MFDPNNKFQNVFSEYDLLTAWIKLLNDPYLAAKVMGQTAREGCYITTDIDEARTMIQLDPLCSSSHSSQPKMQSSVQNDA